MKVTSIIRSMKDIDVHMFFLGKWWLVALATITGLIVGGCQNSPSALDPHGPVSTAIANIAWVLFGTAFIVFLVVLGSLIFGTYRAERGKGKEMSREVRRGVLLGTSLVFLSTVILVSVLVTNNLAMRDLGEAPIPSSRIIDIVGHQYWWEVSYADDQVITANEIHIPVGSPITFRVTSADVIHSFWAPQLQGKVDTIPGSINYMWMQADQPGDFRGQCAEYCGSQHAHMAFHIVADPPEQFDSWLNNQARPASTPTDPVATQGFQGFTVGVCVTCHTIRGTDAKGKIGPDLTHVGSRQWIASGTLQNTHENLVEWIAKPQEVKPGNKMPDFGLDPESDFVQSVATYFESLK